MIIETVNILKTGYGSKLNKLTEDNDMLILIREYTQSELDVLRSNPDMNDALIYVKRILWGECHDYLKPLHDVPNTVGCMFGGNKGELCDGRILKVHDRYETQKQYDMYSA